MPRSRFDELVTIAEEHDGLVTAEQARESGFTDSVLARLAKRGRLEQTSRGVYRIPHFRPGRFHSTLRQSFGDGLAADPKRLPYRT